MADEGKEKTRRQADSKRNNLGKCEFLPAVLTDDQYVPVRTESDWPQVENRIECQARVLNKGFQQSTTSTALTSFAAKKCSPAIATWHVAGLDITLVAPGKFSFHSHHECRNICQWSRDEKRQSNTACVQSARTLHFVHTDWSSI